MSHTRTEADILAIISQGITDGTDLDCTPDTQAREVLRQLRAAGVLPQWQPIETAPKDGRTFATINARYPEEIEVCKYDPTYWSEYKERQDGLFEKVEVILTEWRSDNFGRATHWMPLPEAPQ